MPSGGDDGRDAETLRAYWLWQWERISRLEDQRLQFSNLVVAASVVAIGLSAGSDTSPTAAAVVAGTVAAANFLAWVYSVWSDRWLLMHHRRANTLIEDNWPYIADLKARAGRPDERFPVHGHTIQAHRWLHVVLGLATVALMAAALIDA